MSVAGSPRRSPSCRWRKRHRPGEDWWGPPVRFIVDQGCGYLFTVLVFPFWLLFSGVWETLIFGTGDWFAFGELFFVACLPQLTHCLGTGSCPNHILRRFAARAKCSRHHGGNLASPCIFKGFAEKKKKLQGERYPLRLHFCYKTRGTR